MAAFRQLSPIVEERLNALYFEGFCLPEDISTECIDFLSGISEGEALSAIRELTSMSNRSIKNVSAFFMGLLRKRHPFPGTIALTTHLVKTSNVSVPSEADQLYGDIPPHVFYHDPQREYVPKMPFGYNEIGFNPYVRYDYFPTQYIPKE